MARKTEAEFVNEGLTDDEIETLGTGQLVSTGANGDQNAQGAQQEAQPGADPAQQQEPKTVDVRALQEARAEARAAREEMARLKAEQTEQSKKDAIERARIEERIAALNQHFTAQQQPQVKVPSEDEDPLGFFKHEISSSKAEIEALKKQLVEREETDKKRASDFEAGARQMTQNQAIIATADHVISTAIAANPPLQEAFNFALDGIRRSIVNAIETNNVPIEQRPMMAQKMLDEQALRLAAQCPRDPAQAAEFVMSHARFYGYGYQPQQNGQQAQTQQQTQPAQQQTNIQQRAEQQQRHMSLSGTQGGQPPGQLNAKALAEMSDEQFTALMKTADGRKKVDSILAGN